MAWKIVYDNKLSHPYLDTGSGRVCFGKRLEGKLVLHLGTQHDIPWEALEVLYDAQLQWEKGKPSVELPTGWIWEQVEGGEWAAKDQYGICYVSSNGTVTTQKVPPEVVKLVLDVHFARNT